MKDWTLTEVWTQVTHRKYADFKQHFRFNNFSQLGPLGYILYRIVNLQMEIQEWSTINDIISILTII